MTTLYRIPNKYFPAVKVHQPFHAKVNYEVKAGVIIISDVCLSPLCLQHISNTGAMVTEMKEIIQAAEAKCQVNSGVHPTIMAAIAPHI